MGGVRERAVLERHEEGMQLVMKNYVCSYIGTNDVLTRRIIFKVIGYDSEVGACYFLFGAWIFGYVIILFLFFF